MYILLCALIVATSAQKVIRAEDVKGRKIGLGWHICDIANICEEGQVCIPQGEDATCACLDGYIYHGNACVPTCKGPLNPCPEDSDCLLESNSTFSCVCHDGDVINEAGVCQGGCEVGICPDDMSCSETDEAVRCACPTGLIYKDGACVAECDTEPCSAGTSCVSYNGVHRCCPEGHLPDNSGVCTPVCLLDVCEEGLECLVHNINGSYSCICPDYKAYNTDGKCVDFCDLGICKEGMECVSKYNGFNCSCGTASTCSTCGDNPCNMEMVCEQHTQVYECVCDTGFTLKDGSCVDVNECEEDVCMEGEKCINTLGSYECYCGPGTRYNVVSGTCQDVNECLADACSTLKSGMLCINTVRGFSCSCPPGFPEARCQAGDVPCTCSDHEMCQLNGECTCDAESVRDKTSSSCHPNPQLREAANMTLPKEAYEFQIGSTRNNIKVRISDWENSGSIDWRRVTWVKLPNYVITKGGTVTPLGNYRTPYLRKLLVFSTVRPGDGGDYKVIVTRPGYRTASKTIHVDIKAPLKAISGPVVNNLGQWEFKVAVQARLNNSTLTWYRFNQGHLERLAHNNNTVVYLNQGTTLRVVHVQNGTYIARLTGSLQGRPIMSEVRFDSEH